MRNVFIIQIVCTISSPSPPSVALEKTLYSALYAEKNPISEQISWKNSINVNEISHSDSIDSKWFRLTRSNRKINIQNEMASNTFILLFLMVFSEFTLARGLDLKLLRATRK